MGVINFNTEKNSKEPPNSLFGRIISRINSEKKLEISRRKAFYFGLALLGSISAFLIVCAALQNILVQSELLKMLSLIFSDPKEILANWQDFSLMMLESLPAVSLAIFFVALFVLLGSLRQTAKYLAQVLSWSKKINAVKKNT